MAKSRTTQSTSFLVLGLVAALLSQNFVFPVCSTAASLRDEKNIYFPPFPSFGAPLIPLTPPVSLTPPVTLTPPVDPSTPPISYSNSPPPTHSSGGSSPPVHHTPSHGGGSGGGGHHHGGSPPANCGNPTTPHSPPKHHVTPSPVHHNPSPAPPTGGYHYSSPPPSGGTTPSVPSSPPSPIILPPITPGLPFTPPPFDPNSPPIGGTCDFWRNHPGVIWGLFGWFGPTIGSAFGVGTLPGTGADLNLVQALSNTRTDGLGALYREGTASLLNSMVNKHFPFTTSHVKDSFAAAVASNKAAAAQARVFKLANEGHMKLRD